MRFLPGVFMDAMRDNAEAAVHIFEGTHENPELIWNDGSREKVSTTVREMMIEYDTFDLMTFYCELVACRVVLSHMIFNS